MKNEGFFHGDFHGFLVFRKNGDLMGFDDLWFTQNVFFSDLDGDSIRDLLLRCSKPGDFSRGNSCWV
jgi:DNA polymerase III delta subunit